MKYFRTTGVLLLLMFALAACSQVAEPEAGDDPEPTEAVAEEEPSAEESDEESAQDEGEESAEESVEEESSDEVSAIRIGVLNPTSGTLAANGEDVNEGIQLYFDSIDYMAGGANIELSYADTAANPEQALEQARRLVEQENVDFLVGVVSSSVVVPLADFVD